MFSRSCPILIRSTMVEPKNGLDDHLHWYKDAVIYELHIKAFCDGNGDGIGDFQGLMTKLDYLQDLGVTAIWLLPFYPSPLRDDGYDIADYYRINPAYGDVRQFRQLLKEAHKRDLKVINELVINHTSDQHPWFQRSRTAPQGSPYRDFYVWTDDPGQYKDVRIIFQDFETSNWTWDPVAQQYYWHRFFHHQPDLNYDSPLVREEILRIIDFWCKMGVDGFRLDAIPYLFEREGTNSENLPETHGFLKQLRKHMDDNYPGKLLLAEANMWPEDAVSYFGDGDECHMNFHFPVMPRMFMALQMEDRYPITDIFEQTPSIPANCQWAIFLRNHDELTLEMVTDEERDYMYKVYVKDPKARINLGIRHRLAPLMENNRKKIELLNCLLLSLPGTPVIYYGDEIGMGDNFYLGDRNGVRTPMQWNGGRNAGFSEANPQKLYLPVILDPEYHYESVNVEIQSQNTSSLLWWMKRVIHVRRNYKAFGRGELGFIPSDNAKILAFTRSYEEETMLVVVNLSRYAQPVELDMRQYGGYQPVEVFSKNRFPAIKEDTPYFFTLSGYDCQWFLLDQVHPGAGEGASLPLLKLASWKELLTKSGRSELENHILRGYLPRIRWFGGKGNAIQQLRILDSASVPLADSEALLLLLEVSYQSGLPEIYHLPLGMAVDEPAADLRENCPQAVIARLRVGDESALLVDALYLPAFRQALLRRMATNKHIIRKDGTIHFSGSQAVRKFVREQEDFEKARSRVLSAEQSNTSVVYNNSFFLKMYRKVDQAINPDQEIIHFLSKHAGFQHIPAFSGSIQWKQGKETMVLGMMQELVENHGDAWTYMLDRLNDFYERVLSRNKESFAFSETAPDLINPPRYRDIPLNIQELMDGSVAERARLLGIRTGEMHRALASGKMPDFQPESFSLHYQRSLYSSLQSLVRASFQQLAGNLNKLPAEQLPLVEQVLDSRNEILQLMRRIYRKKIDAVKIRVHGDYHLGQILLTGKDFVILDFEGEPARPYSERRLKRAALRDVAGMFRSFHYAAYASLLLGNPLRQGEIDRMLPFADLWYQYMSGFFMQAYRETVRDTLLIPADEEDLAVLLQTFLLEKAVYELKYELDNRPDWVIIPLRGILSLLYGSAPAETRK